VVEESWLPGSRVLTPLQERVAAIVGSVFADKDFGLAGGAALISQGLVNRLTNDLDFLARRETS
jgi:hypothetical protein